MVLLVELALRVVSNFLLVALHLMHDLGAKAESPDAHAGCQDKENDRLFEGAAHPPFRVLRIPCSTLAGDGSDEDE